MVAYPARWLILKGRDEEAPTILLRLHDDPNDVHHTFARIEFLQITKQVSSLVFTVSTFTRLTLAFISRSTGRFPAAGGIYFVRSLCVFVPLLLSEQRGLFSAQEY